MDYLEIQNSVLSDRFSEEKRDSAKQAINSRYGRLWLTAGWSFRYALANVVVPLGANTLPKGVFHTPIEIYDETNTGYYPKKVGSTMPQDLIPFRSTSSSGYPIEFTVIGDTIYLDRNAPTDTDLIIYGELAWVPLVSDEAVPLLPEEFHYMLVVGAASDLLKLENDPSYKPLEDTWEKMLEDMKKGYLGNTFAYSAWPGWP